MALPTSWTPELACIPEETPVNAGAPLQMQGESTRNLWGAVPYPPGAEVG